MRGSMQSDEVTCRLEIVITSNQHTSLGCIVASIEGRRATSVLTKIDHMERGNQRPHLLSGQEFGASIDIAVDHDDDLKVLVALLREGSQEDR